MAAPRLVLGPLLRYVGEHDATIWVETDAPCEVEVLGHRARTFSVEGHHYALVVVGGLDAGSEIAYEVVLDGEVRWPEPNAPFPASTIRTLARGRTFRLLFGSCRAAAPHLPPYSLRRDEHHEAREVDALLAYARRMASAPRDPWPDALLMLGDQVYADELSPATRQFIRERRDISQPPGLEVADFEEYCCLYRESWSEPGIRWLLSTVPSAMVFDDHDVHDDWNISASWLREYRARPWWRPRIVGAYMSYWIYQHLGNLSPAELERNELWKQVRESDDPAALLREFAFRADRTTEGVQWSFHRDFDGARLIVVDSRGGRVLEDGRRLMVDADEWGWVEESASGDWDHLLLASSLPFVLPRGIHGLEAWNEAVCDGVWGARAARLGERIRRAIDLEHWAAFGKSFDALQRLLGELASGARGRPPASVVMLSGDVHYAYLAEIGFPREVEAASRVYQAVCSPMRNPLPAKVRRAQRFAASRAAAWIGAALARAAGVEPPRISWDVRRGPWFHNELATLELDGRSARLKMERSVPAAATNPRLELVFEYELA